MKILGFGTQKSDVLQNVRVASPCPASWDKMAGDDRARHCSECNLKVYNISAMTRREAEELLTAREGRLCVRYYRRADSTILTQDCPRGLRAAARRLRHLATAALAALMSVSFAAAQTPSTERDPQRTQSTNKKHSMAIVVVDATGNPVANAKVVLEKSFSGKIISGNTDSNGILKLAGVGSGPLLVTIQKRGFTDYSQIVKPPKHQDFNFRVELIRGENSYAMGVVGMASILDISDSSLSTVIDSYAIPNIP